VARLFTLEEANALVPRVAAVLGRTTQMLGRLRLNVRRLSEAGFGPSGPGQLPEDADLAERPDLLEVLGVARMLADTIRDEVRTLEALGIVVRDVERGLLDFRSIVDGEREVFLCWHLGEREIAFFHDLDSGYVGRQPVEGHQFFRSRQLRAPSD
jgi:hypothetical protein